MTEPRVKVVALFVSLIASTATVSCGGTNTGATGTTTEPGDGGSGDGTIADASGGSDAAGKRSGRGSSTPAPPTPERRTVSATDAGAGTDAPPRDGQRRRGTCAGSDAAGETPSTVTSVSFPQAIAGAMWASLATYTNIPVHVAIRGTADFRESLDRRRDSDRGERLAADGSLAGDGPPQARLARGTTSSSLPQSGAWGAHR